MTTNILGVRPYPLSHESVSGYLLRLCYLNGIERIPQLLSIGGCKTPKNQGFHKWGGKHFDDALSALEVLLHREKANVFSFNETRKVSVVAKDYTANSSVTHDDSRAIQDLTTPFLRICPLCFCNEAIIHSSWQCGTVARCAEHKNMLIDYCPCCNERLEWHSDVFTKCTKCSFKWSDYEPDKLAEFELSDIELALTPTNDGKILVESEVVNDISTLVIALARPYDLYIDSFDRIQPIKNYSDLLLQAINHYVNDEMISRWVKARKPILNDIVAEDLLPVSIQDKLIRSINVCYHFTLPLTDEYTEHSEFVKLKRRTLLANDDVKLLRHHIQAPQLASLLGLHKKDFNSVVAHIKPLNKTPALRARVFDLTKVSDYLKSQTYEVTSENRVIVNRKSQILRVFLSEYGEVLNALLNKKVVGELKNHIDLSEICVDYDSLISFLTKQRNEQLKSPVSIMKSARCLRCGPKKVQQLVKFGILQYAPWQRSVNKITGESMLIAWNERYSEDSLLKIAGL